MIIFGTRARYKTIKTGTFFCPHCQKERHYDHKQGKTYFALYFIPILPIGDAGEFIECQHCGRTYSLEVLNFKPTMPPQNDVARMLNDIKAKLERGMSVEYVIGDLTLQGLDRDIAGNMVKMVTGDRLKECPKCKLTYSASVYRCPDCGMAL